MDPLLLSLSVNVFSFLSLTHTHTTAVRQKLRTSNYIHHEEKKTPPPRKNRQHIMHSGNAKITQLPPTPTSVYDRRSKPIREWILLTRNPGRSLDDEKDSGVTLFEAVSVPLWPCRTCRHNHHLDKLPYWLCKKKHKDMPVSYTHLTLPTMAVV